MRDDAQQMQGKSMLRLHLQDLAQQMFRLLQFALCLMLGRQQHRLIDGKLLLRLWCGNDGFG